jgi:small-conductance mechanosensitive channel
MRPSRRCPLAPRLRGLAMAVLVLFGVLALVGASVGVSVGVSVRAWAQSAPEGVSPETPPARAASGFTAAEAEDLAALLRDEARRAELLRTLDALAAAGRLPSGTSSRDPAPGGPAALGFVTPTGAPAPQSSAGPAPPAQAQSPSPPVAPTGAPSGAAPGAPEGAAEEPIITPNTTGALLLKSVQELGERIGPVSRELLDAARGMADLPHLWGALQGLAANPVARARAFDAAWILMVALGAGLLVEHGLFRLLAPGRRRLDALAPPEGTVWSWFRRMPLLLGRLVLDLLPIAALIGTVHLLLELLQPLPTTRVIALGTTEIYAAARGIFATARLLLAPRSQRLRLIPVSDRTAWRGLRRIRLLLLVGLGGYTLAEAGIALGLSWGAYDALLNVTLLLISLMLATMIVRSREGVAALLRAPPIAAEEDAPDRGRLLLRSLRNGLAEIWHVLTILWLLAAWVVWALAIEDGISRLLTSTLLSIALVIGAKALDDAFTRLLDRMVAPSGTAAAQAARAATWLPVLRTMASILVTVGGLLLLFEIWGFDSLAWFARGTLGHLLLGNLASIAATFVAAAVVWEMCNAAIARRLTRLASQSGQAAARSARIRTLLPMLRTALGIVIVVFLALSTLAELGVNVGPLLAGAGVIGLAIGFGSQTLVRDVITGVFLLLEDAVAVGDVVQLAGLSGVVENLSIRSIKLRALDGSLHIIPFSAVTTVTNMTRDFSFAVMDITVGFGEDTDHVGEVLREIGREMRAEPKWAALMRDEIDVWGVERIGESGVLIRARAKTEPAARWNVARELNRRIKRRFAELGIEIPYPYQRVVMDAPELRYPPRPHAAEPRAAE